MVEEKKIPEKKKKLFKLWQKGQQKKYLELCKKRVPKTERAAG